MPEPSFFQRVYDALALIPPGHVVSYGQIALYLGAPGAARAVGWAMRTCPPGLPWHRVVNARGELRTGDWVAMQRERLEDEGVVVGTDNRVDLKCWGWDGF